MSGELSVRTQIRDAFITSLRTIDLNPDARVRGAEIVNDYINEEEMKTLTACYGVIVTDEEIDVITQGYADVTVTILTIIWVRSEKDNRALLDAALEDMFQALLSGQLLRALVSQLRFDGIQTDEGTRIAKPYAQAKMRWKAKFRRTVTW